MRYFNHIRAFAQGDMITYLTDLYWKKLILPKFVENYNIDPSPIQDKRWAYYNDTDRIDQ